MPVNRNFYLPLPLFIDTVVLLLAASECEVQVAAAHRRNFVLLRDSRIIDVLLDVFFLRHFLAWSEECEAAVDARE